MKQVQKKYLPKIAAGILIWLGLLLLMAGVVGKLAINSWNLIQHGNFLGAQQQSGWAKKLLQLTPYLSLGMVKLPGLTDFYDVGLAGVETEYLVSRALIPVPRLVDNSLHGQSTPQETVEHVAHNLDLLRPQLTRLSDSLKHIDAGRLGYLLRFSPTLEPLQAKLWSITNYINQLGPMYPILDSILGYSKKEHYVVLLQNNMELRPTGGYLGSYADFYMDKGAVVDLHVQDIGVPNGQIKGYVKEPVPLSRYLFDGGTPGWHLRDSNWDPDFTKAAETMRWFFEEGGVAPIDTLVGVNLLPIQNLLEITGPLYLPDYPEPVTADSFYQLAQYYAEHEFFPGSTQKADYLGDVSKQLLWKLEHFDQRNLSPLLALILNALDQKQILIASTNQDLASVMRTFNVDGKVVYEGCTAKDGISANDQAGCVADYLMINEANLGVNKTNCCIDRHVTDSIVIDANGNINHTLDLYWKNRNDVTPHPPKTWGGGYHVYVRVYVPRNTAFLRLTRNEVAIPLTQVDLTPEQDFLAIGFLGEIGGLEQATYQLTYQIKSDQPVTKPTTYIQTWQKQSGIESIPYSFRLFQGDTLIKEGSRELTQDEKTVITW